MYHRGQRRMVSGSPGRADVCIAASSSMWICLVKHLALCTGEEPWSPSNVGGSGLCMLPASLPCSCATCKPPAWKQSLIIKAAITDMLVPQPGARNARAASKQAVLHRRVSAAYGKGCAPAVGAWCGREVWTAHKAEAWTCAAAAGHEVRPAAGSFW